MNPKKLFLLLLFAFLASTVLVRGQGNVFTYQGRLTTNGVSLNGTFNMQARIFDAQTNGTLVASRTLTSVNVQDGLFTVEIVVPETVFNGEARFLEWVLIQPGGGTNVTLSPRQWITPSPYAVMAQKVFTDGVGSNSIRAGSITSSKIASGQVIKSINGLRDDVSLVAGANISLTPAGQNITISSPTWSLTGNSGTAGSFLGNIDNQPLNLRANNQRGLSIEYASRSISVPVPFTIASMNVVGGYWGNFVNSGVIGGVIAGGGHVRFLGGPISYPNAVIGDYGFIGGGYSNVVGASSVVPGGFNNSATGSGSFAAGREAHTIYNGSFVWSDGTQIFNGTGHNRFEVLSTGGIFLSHGSEGLNLDQQNLNNGSINYGLRFGAGSGEGIGSKRSSGGNAWGLDFYTDFTKRMSIAQWGGVGVGTDSPQQSLDVNGQFLQVRGLGGEAAYIGGDGSGNDVQVGSLNTNVSNVAFYNAANSAYMNVYCKSLTILGGADLAEPFEMSHAAIPEGAVVIIDEANPGRLKMSDTAYDTHVAGIISGAGGINPGIQLKQQGVLENGQNVALTGRVYALADAASAPIRPGDLLTTSSKAGRCMRATDRNKAQGAILGKAMTGLAAGEGKVLVLVTLQ